MKTLNNPKPIQEIVEALPNLKQKIEKTTYEMMNYVEYLKDEKFIEQPNEKEEEGIKRAESIYDRLDEIVQRRKVVIQNGKETIHLIDIVKFKIEEVLKNCENDEFYSANANIELIDKMKELEERKRIRDIKPFQDKIDDINNKSKEKIQELDILKKPHEDYKRKKEEDNKKQQEEGEVKKRLNTIIDLNEIKQMEEWTHMKVGNVVFDSNIDNWNIGTSVFDQKILNKSHLIFIIEDDDGNKFGGYVNSVIDKYYPTENGYIDDPNSFVFSLKSNGRLSGMKKFDITNPEQSFVLWDKNNGWLFSFGNYNICDICVWNSTKKTSSFCTQQSFNYRGIENALCGKRNFTPKRITVIQLI